MVSHFLQNLDDFVSLSINLMCEVISIYIFLDILCLLQLTLPKMEFSM